ncbi:hypothetical protein Sme01_59520 [Sphaerisporangium melleum]|uniref:ATP-binding protein n=1 Tax=Sphaerisporangium melleum TaxID=321316 RepID=A0A917VL86_9ACTN|nr:hypothetical protein [Sphaerisporangium melleum]GGK92834.1 hypothetical protein GCM10007964_39210 [Sphaerisporangium melleum]GII73476.1 hypothetical protein Sme01_59520 [Sphaerisporangium melleum]
MVVLDDGSPCAAPSPRTAGAADENGRGLAIVRNPARRWGTYRDGARRAVWFQIVFQE